MTTLIINEKLLREPYCVYIPDSSFQDLLDFANEDISCELLDGVLVIHSPASFTHESIFKLLLILLELFGQQKNLGRPIGSRFIMKLSDKWSPEPDILFITHKEEQSLTETYLNGPAPMVVEILSKSNRKEDLDRKLPQYLSHGVKEVWIVDYLNKDVSIHWQDGFRDFSKDEWVESKIIPEFKVKTEWLWNAKDVSAWKAVKEIVGPLLNEIDNRGNE